jgi:small subunit ribosomal protein S17
MEKTLVVSVKRVKVHPLYKKRFVVRKKYYVHNELPEVKIDSIVKIRETTPMSKLKRRLCVEVVQA